MREREREKGWGLTDKRRNEERARERERERGGGGCVGGVVSTLVHPDFSCPEPYTLGCFRCPTLSLSSPISPWVLMTRLVTLFNTLMSPQWPRKRTAVLEEWGFKYASQLHRDFQSDGSIETAVLRVLTTRFVGLFNILMSQGMAKKGNSSSRGVEI